MHKCTHIPALALALALLCCCTTALPTRAQNDQPDPPRNINLDLDPDVLVFIEPLREDGTIDYLAALNKQLSGGVTKDNNAFRSLYLVYPRELDWNVDEDYFDKLDNHLDVQPDELKQRNIFKDQRSFAEERGFDLDFWFDLLEERIAGPFNDEDGQKIVDWLNVNEKAFDLVLTGIERPFYWRPLVAGSGLLIEVGGIDGAANRMICRGLRYRSNYYAAAGDREKAINSLFAIVRIAELQSMNSGLLSTLYGYSYYRIAGDCLDDLLESGHLDANSLGAISNKWQQHKPGRLVANRFEDDLRSLVQDSMMQIASGRETAQNAIYELRGVRKQKYLFDTVFTANYFDINLGLSLIANYFKERAAMLRASPYAKYAKVNRKWEEVDQQAKIFASKNLLSEIDGELALRPNVSGEKRTAYATTLMLNYLDNGHAAMNVEYQWHAKHALLHIAIAIERYRLKHGKLPATLDALVPDHLAGAPTDPFNGEPMRYIAKETGFIVYAVGRNLKDDGGLDDRHEGDVVVEINWLDD